MMQVLNGSLVALVTPMFPNGDVDYKSLEKLIDWHISEGTNGIVSVGTTGESATLNFKEHLEVIGFTSKYVNKRIPVVAGSGANSTSEAIELTRKSKELGADACLLVTPYYNKPTQNGPYYHYKKIADEVNIPQILYNVPGRTSVDMLPDTVYKLSNHPNIIGIKEASGDIKRSRELLDKCSENLSIFTGDDKTSMRDILLGFSGNISVTANVAPRLCAQFQQATLKGDFATALKITDKLMPLHQAIFTEPGLCGAKYGLSLLGLCSTEVRAPLTQIHRETKTKIRDAMKFAGIL